MWGVITTQVQTSSWPSNKIHIECSKNTKLMYDNIKSMISLETFFVQLLPPLSHLLPTNVHDYVPCVTIIIVWVQHFLDRKFHDSINRNGPIRHGKKLRGRWHNNQPRQLNHEITNYNQLSPRTRTRRLWRKKRSPRMWRIIWEIQPTSIQKDMVGLMELLYMDIYKSS